MKSQTIEIPGFTSKLIIDERAALSIHGAESVGKTRLSITAPDPIGLLAIDKKSKRTAKAIAEELEKRIVVNTTPFISDADLRTIAMLDDDASDNAIAVANLAKVKKIYYDGFRRFQDSAVNLASSSSIESIVIDTGTQVWDWIVMSHFGRRTKIPPLSRTGPNQDMIDLINALKSKHLIIINRSKETWTKTGRKTKDGEDIKEPSGKFEMQGFKDTGYNVTAAIELYVNKGSFSTAEKKFSVRVEKCQTNTMLEGRNLDEYAVRGEEITWDNLARTLEF